MENHYPFNSNSKTRRKTLTKYHDILASRIIDATLGCYMPWKRDRGKVFLPKILLDAAKKAEAAPKGNPIRAIWGKLNASQKEMEQATDAMALRIWPEESLAPTVAQTRLRDEIHRAVEPLLRGSMAQVLDLGCSVGVSTLHLGRWLRARAEQRQEPAPCIQGLDLSPDMLAVARVRDREGLVDGWLHAAAENTGLADASFDLISLQFVCHELPQDATHAVLGEAARLLRPGSALVMVDQDPASSVLQRFRRPWPHCSKAPSPTSSSTSASTWLRPCGRQGSGIFKSVPVIHGIA